MNTAHDKRHAITPRQIKAIHATLHKLGIDDGDYRNILQSRYRVDSCKQLTWRQAEELLESWNGARPGSSQPSTLTRRSAKYAELDGRPGMANGKQCRMIEAMWADVSRAHTDEEREHALWVFLRRITGVDHFRFLKSWQVQMAVKALNEMKKAKEGQR